MKLAFLGCGYVANMYRITMEAHSELELVGVFDIERSRSENMARLTKSRSYSSFSELLEDQEVECVLNFTTPEYHFETTMSCLKANKHVYTEKPLAMDLTQAVKLVKFAKSKALMLGSAPCTLMSEVAQTTWHCLNNNMIGQVRLVYAEMEDGMVSKAPYRSWINEAGTAWPYVNEFETGCTVEHAGYVLTWLAAFFGPAEKISAFADTILLDKIPGQKIKQANDYSVANIKFANDVIARMTNGIYAKHDHQMQFFGDDGVLTVEDPRSDNSKISIQKYYTIRRRRFLSPFKRKIKLLNSPLKQDIPRYRGSQVRDFCRSISDMAFALLEKREPYMNMDLALHVTELTLATQNPQNQNQIVSTFKKIEPLKWSK